jgi:hypothetical protein
MSQRFDSSTSNSPLSPSRRAFLGRIAALGVAGIGGSTLLAACGDGADTAGGSEYPVVNASTCQGYDALDQQALASRQALNYQDSTPEEGQYCGNCRFQQAYDQDTNCIGCQLFAGPVSPGGWCQSWVVNTA